MTLDQTANFVRGEVASSVASGDTTIDVVDASIYPDPANGNYNIVIWDTGAYSRPDEDPDAEVMRVTGRDTTNDNLTVTRGQENTTAVSHPSTSEIHLSATAKMFEDIDLNKVELSGDTMTGALDIDASFPQQTITDTVNGNKSGFKLEDPTAANYGGVIYFDDAASETRLYGLNNGTEQGGLAVARDSDTVSITGDFVADDGELIWDESATYIPTARLEHEAITVAGNSVSLGGSTAINHTNLSNINSDDHHIKYSDENAQDAVGPIVNGGTNITTSYDDGNNQININHADTSTQGNVSTGGATVIDDIGLDGRGHVDNLNTENRSLDDWGSSIDDQIVGFGSNTDFSWFYDSSADELVLHDETNSVDLIRQPKQGSTQFLQGADIGSIEAPEDSFTQLANAAATSASASGDTVGYTFAVDNQTGFEVSATSDGSGGLSSGPIAALGGDLEAANGEVIWDESATYIPQGRLQNDTVTIEGNSVSLGGSTSVNHNDLSTISSDDHHAKYTDSDAVSAIETNNLTDITFTDADADGNNWQLTEDGTNGHLNVNSVGGGGTQMDLEHNGNMRIGGEITENASL